MKRFALALLALGLLSTPASAQYWGGTSYFVHVAPVSPYLNSYYTPWDYAYPEYCYRPAQLPYYLRLYPYQYQYRDPVVSYNPNYVEPAYGGGPQEIINPYVN